MDSISFMPMKAVLCCMVKQALLKDVDGDLDSQFTPPDQALIKDLCATLRQSERYQARYASCSSKATAAAIASDMVNEVVSTYRNIQLRQQDNQVQTLNDLI